MSRIANIREHCNGQTKLYDFYKEAYPIDDWGIDGMNKGVTFQDAFECLQVGFNFYAFLGVSDTIVRERIFDALATLMGCSYDHIYYQWRDHSKEPLRGAIIEDMTGMRFKKQEDADYYDENESI